MEKITFFCYPRCSTCQKAKKWLEENKIEFTERDIVKVNPTEEELTKFYKASGKELKKFFNEIERQASRNDRGRNVKIISNRWEIS